MPEYSPGSLSPANSIPKDLTAISVPEKRAESKDTNGTPPPNAQFNSVFWNRHWIWSIPFSWVKSIPPYSLRLEICRCFELSCSNGFLHLSFFHYDVVIPGNNHISVPFDWSMNIAGLPPHFCIRKPPQSIYSLWR